MRCSIRLNVIILVALLVRCFSLIFFGYQCDVGLSACWSGLRERHWYALEQTGAVFCFLPQTWLLCCGWDCILIVERRCVGKLLDTSGDAGGMQRAIGFILGKGVGREKVPQPYETFCNWYFFLKKQFSKKILWYILNYIILVKMIKLLKNFNQN